MYAFSESYVGTSNHISPLAFHIQALTDNDVEMNLNVCQLEHQSLNIWTV